jgi:hypothetical protein
MAPEIFTPLCIYRVYQEECTIIQENLLWVELRRYRYNQRFLYLTFNSCCCCCCCCWAFVASHECTAACWLIVPPAFERSIFSLLDAPAPTYAFRTPAAEVGTTMSGNRPINLRLTIRKTILKEVWEML